MGEASPSTRDSTGRTCEDHEEQERHHAVEEQRRQAVATAAFHVSRPSNPIAAILSPPPLHQTSIVLEDPYSVSRMLLHGEKFQQQQHQHHKLVGRSTSGLEELIMSCTPTDMKGEASLPTAQETEWLKYSYWPDPDNPDHHG